MNDNQITEIQSAMQYIQGIAGQFYRGHDLADLLSIVREKVLLHYDASKGASVKTFAVMAYNQSRAILKQERMGLSMSVATVNNELAGKRGEFYVNGEKKSTADHMTCASLNAPIGQNEDGGEATLGDMLENDSVVTPREMAERNDTIRVIRETLIKLHTEGKTEAKQVFVLHSYFIYEKTLAEIAAILGCTAANVAYIKDDGIARLKREIAKVC